jgi:GNAT superfamily N-acetyltransferase
MSNESRAHFRLRDAHDRDIPALAALHVKTFNETHRGGRPGGPSYELRERQWRDAFERHGSWFGYVVEDDHGELVGFAKGTPHDGGVPGYAGELNKIYLLQRVQRKGLGRFLERGVASMLLFGDAENPSNGFYEAFGAERLYSDQGEFNGGYGWPDQHKLIARCSG